jgi:glycosidase
MVLLATIRGIPQIYYGSELGMAGKKSKGDGDIRQDFPGGWPGDKQNAFVAEERTKKQKQYFDFTAKLLQWRKNKAVIHKGKTLHFIPQEDVYVYFRILNEERVMVVLNNNSEAKTIDLNRFKEGIQSFLIGIDVLSGKQFDLSSKLSIGGEQSLVLELN